MRIDKIFAQEVFDSRGNPTTKVYVSLDDGTKESAIVPSGASTGKREALELRDQNKNRFLGKGVLKACENVDIAISEALVGVNPYDQGLIDGILRQLDGTKNFSKLGANAALGVSMAVARAAAKSLNIPLYRYLGGANALVMPTPMLNIINGGSHADNTVDFQEYMIMPIGFDTFSNAIKASAEIYQHLKKLLHERNHITSIGDEGGFAPNLTNNVEPIEIILQAIERAGYKPGEQVALALDVASSELIDKDGLYDLAGEKRKLNSQELVEYYEQIISKYPVISIEDGLGEDDWNGWKYLTERLGNKIQLVGDDLFVTNTEFLSQGIKNGVANAVLIKPNQIGTISQTMQCVRLAQRNNYRCIMSHRSGESEDTFIADLAIALNTGEIKTGSMARSERIAKYNRLLEIEGELSDCEYLGNDIKS